MSLLTNARALAKARGSKRAYTPVNSEEIELALAILKGEVTLADANKVLNLSGGGAKVYLQMFRAVREAYNQGKLKIIK